MNNSEVIYDDWPVTIPGKHPVLMTSADVARLVALRTEMEQKKFWPDPTRVEQWLAELDCILEDLGVVTTDNYILRSAARR